MRFAYADPPYLGLAVSFYGKRAKPYDKRRAHRKLITRLVDEFPEGWALHCQSPMLGVMLKMCPPNVRVAAWVKPFCSFKPNVNPGYGWEPIIFTGGRKHRRTDLTVVDWISCSIATGKGLRGSKPTGVAAFVLNLLNARPDDEVVDLFPGTHTMEKARAQLALDFSRRSRPVRFNEVESMASPSSGYPFPPWEPPPLAPSDPSS